MVRGLNLFRQWFEPYADQYLLIGGTAATLAMDEAGLPFRATKDLDVVLHVEALTPQFGEAFWRFVEAGGYRIRQSLATGRPNCYRFQKPSDESFPVMVELFSRSIEGLPIMDGARCTPVPMGEMVSSLSAILLDDVYYDFLVAGRRVVNGLPWIGADRLIPLKAVAWLDLSRRKADGEPIDSRDVRKHMRDIVQLMQLLSPQVRLAVAPRIERDLAQFLSDFVVQGESLALDRAGADLLRVAQRLATTYGIAWVAAPSTGLTAQPVQPAPQPHTDPPI